MEKMKTDKVLIVNDDIDETPENFLETTRVLEQNKLNDEEKELLAEYDKEVKNHE